MDLAEYAGNLQNLAERAGAQANEAVVVPAAVGLLARIKNRMINRGKNSEGGNIGDYSTTPGYFSKKQFIKTSSFKPQGKNNLQDKRGKGKLPNGKDRKTMYLERGYEELREIQGRRIDIMNFEYSGDTMLAYQMQVGQNSVLLGLTKEKAAKIREGLEARKGKAFYGMAEELQEYSDEVVEGSKQLTIQLLTGA